MESAEVIGLSRDAIYVLMKVSMPVMLIALVVGLIISLFQALTQIQEMTLSFIPKIIAVFFSILFFMPYMINQMKDLFIRLMMMISGQ